MNKRLTLEELQQHREIASKKAGNTYFVYVFREINTQKIIYVGVTRYIGRRLAEHRKALKDNTCYTAIYVYMRANNLEFFKDVEVTIVDHCDHRGLAAQRESSIILKHRSTVLNQQKFDSRAHNTDPRHKAVRCVTTGEEFWAMKPVTEKFKVSRYLLRKAIENNKPIHSGEYFEFIDDYIPKWDIDKLK